MPVEVLVLEPDALQRDLIVMALKRSGFAAVVCETSAEVAGYLLAHKPALLILDLYQIDKNGLDLLEELTQSGLIILTRVIVVSSMGFPEIVSRAKRLGAADFLVKPLNSDLLLERVRRVLADRLDR
jgi:DNA-binding response OmpR family regulator